MSVSEVIFLETTEVLEGQISVFDVLGRNKLNKYTVFYSADNREYEKEVIEAETRENAVRILADRLKEKGITNFLYRFR